jgi:DNA-binding MarR family transcriptional regulator
MASNKRTIFLAFNVPAQVEQNYVFDIWKAFSRAVYLTHQELAPLKIATRHYAAMAILASPNSPATQSTLAKSMGLSPNVVLGMIDYLDRLGYTRRVQNPSNRRENIVLLSKKGLNAYNRALHLLEQVEKELLAPLSRTECEQRREIAKKLEAPLPPIRDLAIEFSP